MKLAHVAAYGPHRAGIYETTRDIIRAERDLGHEAVLLDTGVTGEGRHLGQEDERPGCTVVAQDYDAVDGADLIVTATEIPREVLERSGAPIVFILHGRPEASFKHRQKNYPKDRSPPYDITFRCAQSARFRAFVTLWSEYLVYWQSVVPRARLRATTCPPCDLAQFAPEGPRHSWGVPGDLNLLVADVWREDGDSFHAYVGAVEAARQLKAKGRHPRVHIYSCAEHPGPWWHLFNWAKREGVCGETRGMFPNLADMMRAADVVVSTAQIGTRIVRESLAVGTPVIAAAPNRHLDADWLATPRDARDYARRIVELLEQPDQAALRSRARTISQCFSLADVGRELIAIYEEALSASN